MTFPAELGIARWTEADRTFDDIRSAVQDELEDQFLSDELATMGCYCWIRDISDTWVVYELDGHGLPEDQEGLYQVDYTLAADGTATLGTPAKVQIEYGPATEAVKSVQGRVFESRGTDASGGRVFAVQIIDHGVSKNRRVYPASVLSEAAPLYEGAKAFDHHRSEAELASSTINGLVGQYRDVKPNMQGLEAELHLLPSATHTAEAFDASLNAQAKGLPPLVGISHDVMAQYRTVTEGTEQMPEATKIVRVLSADVVADPAAGGHAMRMVAGGTGDLEPQKGNDMNLQQLLALLRDADSSKRAELLTEHKALIAEWNLDDATLNRLANAMVDDAVTGDGSTGGGTGGTGDGTTSELAGVGAGSTTEGVRFEAAGPVGRNIIRSAVLEANLPGGDRAVETITKRLGERFTETELGNEIENAKSFLEGFERAGLQPTVPGVAVTGETHDKLVDGMDKFFEGDFSVFHSFKQMYSAFTGDYDRAFDSEDFNRRVLKECVGDLYDSARRSSESVTTATFNLALGDSITRQMVAAYQSPNLRDWEALVSRTVPINDFRLQRRDRVATYGVLPSVAEGAPYQPLTSPTNEEASYSVGKKGGTEDITLETIANDDIGVISQIPMKLGLAAARSLWEDLWGVLVNNNTCSYDSLALFHATHSNTTAVALSNAGFGQVATKMRRQTGFGDTHHILSLTPKTLVVPPDLWELGNEITAGPNAVPATTPGATNVPNLWQGTRLIVADFLSDTNDWFVIADPALCPLMELGFYQGRDTPELFSQADGNVGSMFNADKFTYKIRFIYGSVILEHRGFARATQ